MIHVASRVSKILRPIFEKTSVKSLVGSQLAILTLVTGVAGIPTSALGLVPNEAVLLEQPVEVVVKTSKTIVYPVESSLGLSQGYHVFHPGIDIRGALGTPIKPIAAGKIKLIASQRYGYGRHILVDHGDNLVSLYAHLGKIYVEEGEAVGTDEVIGEVGLTGRTTGPHLHLEVYENGRSINPMRYLAR